MAEIDLRHGVKVTVTAPDPGVILAPPRAPALDIAPPARQRVAITTPEVSIRPHPVATDVRLVPVRGPAGAPGRSSSDRHYGVGPPGTIIGAEPGDEYLDIETGDLYVLA